jgi:hypothetical protein
MYTQNIKWYDVDLSLPERERWLEVVEKEHVSARRLSAQALKDMHAAVDGVMPDWLPSRFKRTAFKAVSEAVSHAYRFSGGRYLGEMASWTKALQVSLGEAVLLNCTYELSGMCTAGVINSPTLGMVHVRNMDWPLAGIGKATRMFRFHTAAHEFVAVGVLGHVGVLSGMVPGAYSVTINWAPPEGRPTLDFGPSFLLREVLETCTTYADAVEALAKNTLAAPVFYLVCGSEPGQACVVERTKKAYAIRKMTQGTLVQANHHVSGKFRNRNTQIESFDPEVEEMSVLDYSKIRMAGLSHALKNIDGESTLADVSSCLDVDFVLNEQSFQQMLFVPSQGTIEAWRWI